VSSPAGSAHLVGFSDGGEEALLMAALRPAGALSVLTWGAAGRIEASPELLGGLARLPDDPVDELVPLAAYLAERYGVAGARIMAASWADAMAAAIDAGGDVSRSRAGDIHAPALLIAGTHDPLLPAGAGPRDGLRRSARHVRGGGRRARPAPFPRRLAGDHGRRLAERPLGAGH
jgi:pimeloyl-ACP methyl ester carboxylesterase